jgi:D-lactate dehydrogenase (cytochrome)
MVMAITQRVDLSDAQVKALSSLVSGRISQNESVLDSHGRDESAFPPIRPSAVVTVHTTQEVSNVLAYCNEQKIPVVAFGVGSSLEGHVLPLFGGISLDLSEMDSILKISPDDLTVTVQAGVE